MVWQKTGYLELLLRACGGRSTLKPVNIRLMRPLADQGENLQNFTSLCKTIIEVQNISGNVHFKAWKRPHLIWTPLFFVEVSEGLQDFCTLRRSRRRQVLQDNFENQKERIWKKFYGQILNSFKRRI